MDAAYPFGFDAHTHLDAEAFASDRKDVLERAEAAGVKNWVIAGADPTDWDRVERVAARIGAVWVLGVHPWWVDDDWETHVARLADRPTPHGIGETGLDYYRARDPADQARQQEALEAQLRLARERDVPIVFHCVRAAGDLVRICREDGLPAAGGMVHGWSGSAEQARQVVDLGLMVSIGTDIGRSKKTRRAAAAIPLEALLIETDCPDRPLDGDRGEPADLLDIARRVAEARAIDVETVMRQSAENARRLFGLEDPA